MSPGPRMRIEAKPEKSEASPLLIRRLLLRVPDGVDCKGYPDVRLPPGKSQLSPISTRARAQRQTILILGKLPAAAPRLGRGGARTWAEERGEERTALGKVLRQREGEGGTERPEVRTKLGDPQLADCSCVLHYQSPPWIRDQAPNIRNKMAKP